MKKETSKRLSAGLLASAIALNTVLSISADDGSNYHSAGESGVQGTFTSAPLISFNTIGSSEVPILTGSYESWIDRLDLTDASYARDMYDAISAPDFWTTADNFSESGANIIEADYGNGTSDKFNGLLVLESGPRNYDFTDDEKTEIRSYCRAAFDAFDRDRSEIFWLTGETNFKSIVTYKTEGDVTTYTMKTYLVLKDYVDGWDMRYSEYRDTEVLADAISEMEDAVGEILSGASGTDYEKIKYFNKYLTESNEYNTVAAANGEAPDGAAEAPAAIYGSVGSNGPVCEGYSRAFKVLCDEAEIPCVLVDGTANGGAHMWNYAEIDGVWYAVDVTWNDPVGGNAGAVSDAEREDYLLAGSGTVIEGSAFGSSHIVSNTASLNGTSFTNGPVLNSEAYVPAEDEKEYEAAVGDEKYETLEEAAGAASAGAAVTLLDNITRDSNVTLSSEAEIDLNGNTIDMGDYTLTAEKALTITGEGSVKGTVLFADGGVVDNAAMETVTVSGGSFVFKDGSADLLSVSETASASVSGSSFGGVSAPAGISAILAEGQMYYADGAVITADKLALTSLSGNITVSAGKAAGIIENKNYATSYTYNGSSITAPTKDNFVWYGAEPVFTWSTADGFAPSEPDSYTLTVTSGATDKVSSTARSFTIVINEYTGSASATLNGTRGNNGWIVSEAQLAAPAGYLISVDNNSYVSYISYARFTNETVTYYLKEEATGYILPAQTIDVKVDAERPVITQDAVVSTTASGVTVTVYADDNSGMSLMYSGKLGDITVGGTGDVVQKCGRLVFNNLEPATEYTIPITVADPAGNTLEGTVTVKTEVGIPTSVTAPSLTGVYGTAVKDMTISGGSVKYGTAVLDGTWTVTDPNSSEAPEVGTDKAYILTFTPASSAYTSVEESVTPVVSPLPLTGAVVSGVKGSYSYAGELITPGTGKWNDTKIAVTLNGKALTENTDYIVEYSPNNINSGDDVGLVTVRGTGNYTDFVSVTFDILKIDSVITCYAADVIKKFGDQPFNLSVDTNNSEAPFSYNVGNTDVVEVTGKNLVTIKGAGTAAITVSQPETANYKASAGVTVFVTVTQAAALDVDPVTEYYVYSAKSKGEIDISAVMSEVYDNKCGKMTFSTYENSSLISNSRISEDGILTYDVDKGDIGDKGTVVVTVYSQNYEATTIKVIAELTDKFPTKEKSKVTAGNNITYGQPLSDISFKAATFVTDNGTQVAGTLEWEAPDAIPSVSDKSASWIFTPENTEIYAVCTGTAAITVKQAVPTVTTPTVEGMVYDADRTLADIEIDGADGKATVNGSEAAVKGTWSWSKPATVPNCKTKEYVAVFTPEDSVNYDDVEVKVIIKVTQAQAEITKAPTATAITYGNKVSASTLKNGTANTAGKFTWADGDELYTVGTYKLEVLFTPTDTTNYTGASTTVSLTVNKAKNAPNMPSSKISASFDITTVGGVELPEYWNWDSADSYKGLAVGSSATATAVYNGLDKGNYENESVIITVTRSKCSHKNTKTVNAKDATCIEKGYTGDTYCSDCDTVTVSGREIAVTGHTGGKATCTELAFCTNCRKTYGELDKETHSGTKVIRNAMAATATSAGYTGDVCCSACGAVIEKGTVIPASSGAAVTTPSNSWNDVTTTTKKDSTSIVTTPSNGSTTTTPDGSVQPFIYKNQKKSGWSTIIDDITATKIGDVVEVDMNGTSDIPASVLSALRGKNVDLVLHMNSYFSWVINGMDIEYTDGIDMEVYEGNENISVDIIDQVTGDAFSTTLTLTHNGEFGFKAVLRYEVGSPGYYANLYYYNPSRDTATFVTSDKIDDKGFAELEFDHASEYIVVIDEKDHSSRVDIEYDGDDEDDSDNADYEEDDGNSGYDDSDYEEDDGNDGYDDEDVVLEDDLFTDSDDYYTGGDKNPSTGLGFGHILVGILGVSAFVVRPKNEKRKRKTI